MAKNLFLNYVSEKLIHSNKTADGARQFANVSVPVAGSDNGYGSFAVNLGQVDRKSTRLNSSHL